MLTCQKCGAELHEDQKVCIACGTRTLRGDGFDYSVKKWTPTKNHKIAAGAVLLVLIILWITSALRVMPPEVVAKEWFVAMTDRRIAAAQSYVSQALESDLQARNMDLRAMSDEYYTEVVQNLAKYQIGPPQVNGASASIKIVLSYPEGSAREVNIEMVKDGRRWVVNRIM
ncbi:MAG: zinc ribbon domain-containing protein [Armatimonadetes bacterium]|nr:zinc ribbon domain-containing protein [Armatimonadota bacterium]